MISVQRRAGNKWYLRTFYQFYHRIICDVKMYIWACFVGKTFHRKLMRHLRKSFKCQCNKAFGWKSIWLPISECTVGRNNSSVISAIKNVTHKGNFDCSYQNTQWWEIISIGWVVQWVKHTYTQRCTHTHIHAHIHTVELVWLKSIRKSFFMKYFKAQKTIFS